ncbi:enterobactin exporter EntS [mine drainage metagenome]|uniref:Enterobactin exporter EntS n=1 Tax=mine drainage metagenome TaxID=410659 RepID=A0A1J5TCH3_9ZZZZ
MRDLSLKNTFRALTGRDFRYYFFGQIVSLIGTWVQQVALSWIAYRITGSALILGLVAFSGQIPMLIATPLGGFLADRYSKRNILLCTQVVEMLVAITLSVVAWQQSFSPWILITASAVLGLSGAMEMPSRQAFITEIIHDSSLLSNAIALNSLTFNSARLVGPAIAGLTLAMFNEPTCFAINAISYIASISTLLSIHTGKPVRTRAVGSFIEALTYLRHFHPARWLISTVAVTSFCVAPFMTFMPVYAKDIFHGGPDLLGTLLGASGSGALAASLYLANRKSLHGLGNRIVLACLVGGLASAAFAYNVFLTLALPLLIVSGGTFIMTVTSCNILLQSLVPEHLRGRLMAIYTMSFIGMLPLGSLIYGSLAHHIGSVKPVFIIAGILSSGYGYILMKAMPSLRQAAQVVLSKKSVV